MTAQQDGNNEDPTRGCQRQWTVAVAVTATGAWGPGHGPVATAAEGEGTLVEDCNHPGRDQILAERIGKLIHVDGRNTLADCNRDVIQVHSADTGTACSAVSRCLGWLTAEIPRAYLGRADPLTVGIKLTTDGKADQDTLPRGLFESFCADLGTKSTPTTLVEITARN